MAFPPSSPTDLITELYLGYYDRAPDNTGLQFWISAYNTAIGAGVNGTVELTTLANDFANSVESTAIYPYLSSPNPANASAFVTQVYANVLNRAPDAPGLAFWTNQLTTGQTTTGAFIVTVEASVNMQTGTADAITLADKITVAEDYVQRVTAAGLLYTPASAAATMGPVSGLGNSPTTAAEVTAAEALTTSYISPGQTFSLTDSAGTIAEGQSETFHLATTGVAAGTLLAYTITGTGDAAGQTTSGNLTVDSGGNAVVTVGVPTNAVVGDSGTLSMALVNGKATSPTVTVTDSTPPPGPSTFTLTTGVDVIPGLIGSSGTTDTSGNDTIIGQNTGAAATWTMNPADQINAGAGINQFKLFSDGTAAAVAQAQFPTLTNVEGLWINHFGGTNFLDVTTSKFAQVTAVQLDNVNGGGGGGVNVTLIVANQTVTLSNDSGHNVYSLASAVDTSENVTFNTVGTFGAHSTLNAAFASSHTVTGLTISSTGGPNFVDYESSFANPLQSITFAHSASGDTSWTGVNHGSTQSEVIDASAFTAQWIGGTPGGATAANPFGTLNTAATGWGDSGSSSGDTIKFGSGPSFLAEHGVADGNHGDFVVLLPGHTASNVIDTTDNFLVTYSTVANEVEASTTVFNFNLSPAVAPFGDILKMSISQAHAIAVGSATDIGGTWTNVAGQAGFVTGGTAAQFLAAVFVAQTAGNPTAGHTIAYFDGPDDVTIVAFFEGSTGNGNSHLIGLVGVSTAAGLSLDGTLPNSIHIA